MPTARGVTTLLFTTQTLGVIELKVTANPELAEALAVVVKPIGNVARLNVMALIVWLVSSVKAAVTLCACVMLIVHGLPPPAQALLHPAKLELMFGMAVRVMEVPPTKLLVQVPLHWLIPLGLLPTVPLPVPVVLTVRR